MSQYMSDFGVLPTVGVPTKGIVAPTAPNVFVKPDRTTMLRPLLKAPGYVPPEVAAQKELDALLEQQHKAEAEAAAAGYVDPSVQAYATDVGASTDESFVTKYGQWLWIGGGGVAVLMIVGGLLLSKPKKLAGYRRSKRSRK